MLNKTSRKMTENRTKCSFFFGFELFKNLKHVSGCGCHIESIGHPQGTDEEATGGWRGKSGPMDKRSWNISRTLATRRLVSSLLLAS